MTLDTTDHQLTYTKRWRQGQLTYQQAECSCGKPFTSVSRAITLRTVQKNISKQHRTHVQRAIKDEVR